MAVFDLTSVVTLVVSICGCCYYYCGGAVALRKKGGRATSDNMGVQFNNRKDPESLPRYPSHHARSLLKSLRRIFGWTPRRLRVYPLEIDNAKLYYCTD